MKVRAVGKRAPTKVKAPPSRPAKPATKTKTRPHAAVTPAIKAKAKRAAERLPTPVSVTEVVNQHGDKFEVSELKDSRARVLLTLRVGEAVKVTANGFPRGPMVVEAIERGKSMLTLSLASKRGGKKGRSYLTTYHYPERAKGGKLKEYVPFVLLARSRSSISKIARYNPELEDAKTPKGLRPGAKDWPKAPDKARLQYFRDALYSLAKEKTDHKAEDLRMSLILAVERPLEKSYVCQALKEYGRVPQVRRLRVGDILYTSWGYDQTNVEFYQVVSLTAASAKIRQIGEDVTSRSRGSDRVSAQKGKFLGYPTLTKRIIYDWPHGGSAQITPSLKISGVVTAWLWDGKPKHKTASGYGH